MLHPNYGGGVGQQVNLSVCQYIYIYIYIGFEKPQCFPTT